MELTENKIIKSKKNIVWSALMSPEVLSQCIPGCQQMTGNPQDGFEATVVQKVGPVKATFKGKVLLLDVLSEESLRLSGEGKGGAAGFAKGNVKIVLSEDDDKNKTKLSYDGNAQVGGKLAQVGSRVIGGVVKNTADDFFKTFNNNIITSPADTTSGEQNTNKSDEPIINNQSQKTSISYWVWISSLIFIIAIILAFFT